ncbi:MAG: hypothetical protein QM536_09700 [Chitinophagaceae bacterium]|nr:hypothetical protein [Chitinophagaceae bacterium]
MYQNIKSIIQTYYLNKDASVTSNGRKYGNGETVETQGKNKITTGYGTFENSVLDYELSAKTFIEAGFSKSNLGGQYGGGINFGSLDLYEINMKGNLLKKKSAEIETSFLGENSSTGGKKVGIFNVETNYGLYGLGYEKCEETTQAGIVDFVEKKSITLWGLTFERKSSSSGHWSNSFKLNVSKYYSVLVGTKYEASLTLFKESFVPNF